jgi:hypothetical protein
MSPLITVSELFGDQNVYVIPTFQRPYSWEQPQWNDLKSDVCIAASKPSPYHYFAPIHVIEITDKDDIYWTNYTDQDNDDIKNLSTSGFRDEYGNALKVYLVIDGQQRVTTLYSLLFNSTPKNPRHFINLPSNYQIPRVILNPKNDHFSFRHHLGLYTSPLSSPNSRSQERLDNLFSFLGRTTPLFPMGSSEYAFLTSSNCQLLKVPLHSQAKLASFMTLNDRGKDLTVLEKSKSLLMEVDENYPEFTGPNPTSINVTYGDAYVSIEAKQSYLNDNEFIRQVAMVLWEYDQGAVHRDEAVAIYEKQFKSIATDNSLQGSYIHSDILPAISGIVSQHNNLVDKTNNACQTPPVNLGVPSFVSGLSITSFPRDAIEDYFNVLQSLKWQSKQLGFLMAVRAKWGIELHDVLGLFKFSNSRIKKELIDDFNKLKQEIDDTGCSQLITISNQVKAEIDLIPDSIERQLTPLQIAELLRLIVGNSKPGTYSNVWHSTFNCLCTPQSCVDQWINYLLSWDSRDNFIIDIARTLNADNNAEWVKYLLKEYEYCLSGRNMHRHSSSLDIEHFFGTWSSVSAMVAPTIFSDEYQYENRFRNRIGNKLVLDSSLNRAIRLLTPIAKTNPSYLTDVGATQSSKQISNDLAGISDINCYRLYVLLRSVRLAAFAALRY